jgi:hypothetical protein
MEDDEPKPPKQYPISSSKMSKTPSWIMLGFLLGAAFVASLPPLRKKPPEPVTFKAVEPAKQTGPRTPPQLTTIEAVFAVWGRHAVWSDDVTEVAMWNLEDNAFTDFYEVRRIGGVYYFRTISQLTRRIITHGKPLPSECPLQFTESEEQYREWHSYGRAERPVEHDTRPRPTFTAPPAPAPIDRSIKVTVPSLSSPESTRSAPPLELPPTTSPAKK